MGKTTKILALLAVAAVAAVAAALGDAAPASARERVNSMGMEFVRIPQGTFVMGDLKGEDDEKPLRTVTISKPFYMGKHEVTQEQFERVMGRNPSLHVGRNNPADSVTWDAAREFVRRLNALERTDKYRLPTEAEWEYAARAGSETTFFFGEDARLLGEYDWYKANSGNVTHPVGEKLPTPWGLYDVLGNVGEWVEDLYGEFYYAETPVITDPAGPDRGFLRVVRGGSKHDEPFHCRPADRLENEPDYIFDMIRGSYGFRVAHRVEPVVKRLFKTN
jgi:formylglycine-generating enzyme required for sulfatase activity